MTTNIKKIDATMHEAKFVRPLGGLLGLFFPIFSVCVERESRNIGAVWKMEKKKWDKNVGDKSVKSQRLVLFAFFNSSKLS